MAIPFIAGSTATDLLGPVVLVSGVIELWNVFSIGGEQKRRSAFLDGGRSILIGGLLLSSPILVASALVWLLGGSFIADGLSKLLAAGRNRSQQFARWTVIWGSSISLWAASSSAKGRFPVPRRSASMWASACSRPVGRG